MAPNTVVPLINPPATLAERDGTDMQKFGTEPLGLAYIAEYL